MQKPQRLCQANWDARGYLSLWASNGADISLIDNALSSLEVQIANVQKIYLKSPEAGGFNEKEGTDLVGAIQSAVDKEPIPSKARTYASETLAPLALARRDA